MIQTQDVYYLVSYALILLILCISSAPVMVNLYRKLSVNVQQILTPVLLLLGLILSTAVIVDSTYNPFLYFRF